MSGRRFSFLLPCMRGGGAERVALCLIGDCLAAGHEVDLVLMQAEGELLPLVPPEVRVVDLGAKRVRSVLAPFRAYLRERQPEAVHIMMWPLTIAGIIACRLAGTNTRIITSEHSTIGREYGASRRSRAVLSLTTRIFYPKAFKVLCVSNESADDLARVSGLDRAAIEVIYNPVATPTFPIAIPPSIDAQWGEDCVRILTVASLSPAKNQAMLIRAFARFAQRRPAKLIIVGEGELRDELKQVATAEGVADCVIMPGFTLDPWPYYASADLFVLSSDYEGFSLVIVEAMRCGLNVVSTDCLSGPRELLNGGEYGALTETGNDAKLAEAMEAMIDNPIASEKLQARAELVSGPATSARHLAVMADTPSVGR